MTKTSERIINAWARKTPLKVGNTSTDGHIVCLFGNSIIKRERGSVYIRTAGYPTKTTKERLNSIGGVRVYTIDGELYLNGNFWENHEDWTKV